MSEFLRGKRGYRTKEERSALFEEGKQEYKRVFGGAGAAGYKKIGKAGTDSFKATGKAFCGFGIKRKSRALTEGPAFPCPPAESADAMQLVDLARASLREFSEQQPSDSTQQKKRRVAEDLSAVKAGSDERLRRGSDVLSGIDSTVGLYDVRHAPANMSLSVNPLMPPFAEIGRRVLANVKQGGSLV